MKKILKAGLVLWLVSFAQAEDAGTTGASFLKMGLGPRAIAMGEAHTAVADDAYAGYWNPAGLVQVDVPEVAFNYHQQTEGVAQQIAAGAFPLKRLGTLGASIQYLNVTSYPGYDAASQPIGDVGASDMALTASYGKILWENRRKASQFSAGLSGRYIRETLDSVSANAFAMDAGLHYVAGKSLGEALDGWRAGLSFRNLGTGLQYDSDTADLPRALAAGLAWTGVWLGERMTLAGDAQLPQEGDAILSGGLEIWTFRMLAARAGYTTRGDLGNGLRLGGGLRFHTLQLDYAWAGMGDFGDTHRFGILFHFGKKPEEPLVIAESWYAKGVKLFRKGRYTDALTHFNKALEVDPSHPEALEMMRQCYEKIKESQEMLKS